MTPLKQTQLQKVIEQIKQAKIHLWLDGEKLKFRAEKGAMTAEIKKAIGEVKQEIIEHLKSLPDHSLGAEKQQTIYPHSTDEPAPLSFSQQRLWIIDQLEDNTASYNIPFALNLKGNLNIKALQQSLNGLVERHAALRTSIIIEKETPKQKILDSIELNLEIEPIAQSQLQGIAETELRTRFDLTQDTLMRIRLLQIDQENHVLLLTLHHIISDGWSMGILINELAALYVAHDNNVPVKLPELSIQFTDYAWWQIKQHQQGIYDQKINHWLSELDGAPALHDFATDYPRPPIQSFKGANVKVDITKQQMQALQQFSKTQGVTLFMTLLAALKTLFWKYSGQTDQVIAAPVANRKYPELEGIVGFFANTLVLRSQLDPERSFEHYLQHIKQKCLSAYANQDVPFEQIVEHLQPERSLANNPIFQFMLVLQNQPRENFKTKELSFAEVPQEGNISRFDMTFMLSETSNGIVGEIEYDTALFKHSTIKRFLSRWKIVLETICQQPKLLISQLKTEHSIDESDQVIAGKNSPRSNHELIQDTLYQRLSENSNAVAIYHLDQQYSYGQLEITSNQYANALMQCGARSGGMVALHLKKCPDLVFLTIAIWKIGACFVPLDQKHPEQRLQQMLDDCQANLLITDEAQALLIHPNKVSLQDFKQNVNNSHQHRPVNKASAEQTAEQTAYLMYTSGTTGKPQGILIPHRTITHLMSWETQQMPGPHKVLQFASIGFDLSVLELLLALNSGGSFVIVDDDIRTDTQAICELIQKEHINVVIIPPTVLHHWAKHDDDNSRHYETLQHVITAGEQLELTPDITAFFDRYPHCKLHNQYGPAETHVVTAHTFQAPSIQWPKRAPIGLPIDNVRLQILDAMGQAQQKHTPGELYISGPAVGLGYHGQNPASNNRFIQINGTPYYRTGDKVKVTENGDIEFLGRLDRQVKIRGFRIELDEIERQLNAQTEVVRSVVSIDKNDAQLPRLLAWVVTSDAHTSIDEIRLKLSKQLPSYMVPASISLIDKVPLNHNGKPDIKKLLESANPVIKKSLVAPQNQIEHSLLKLWQSIFPEKSICITDDFFALGGHSLLATQLIARINTELGAGLTLKHLFKYPNIQSLAKKINMGEIDGENVAQIDDSPIAVQRNEHNNHGLPLSFAQQRLWTLQQFEGIGGTYNMPASLVLEGQLDYNALNKSFNHIIDRHEILRTCFHHHGGTPVQHIDINYDISIEPEMVTEDQIESIYAQEAAQPFDLELDRLMRVRLLKLSQNNHVLLVIMHHIISDGWSTGIFVEELTHCYSAYIDNKTPVLSVLPIQYADYAIWQNHWLNGQELKRQLAYWQEQLADSPPLLELPTDQPRPAEQTFNGRSIALEISNDVLKQIQTFCQEHSVTTYMFLLASMQLMLWRYSGQTDISIGSPIANRTRKEFEKMLGCFVNTIVLRSNVTPEHTFLHHLQSVKATTLNAYSHQDIPFEQVIDSLNLRRNVAHSPLFQVMLVLQNTPKKRLKLGDVNIASLPFESSVSRFDMTFNFTEGMNGLSGTIEFNSDLFDMATIQEMLDYFQHVSHRILSEPQATIRNISGLSAAHEQQLIQALKGPETDYRKFSSIPGEIEKIAMLHPDAIALRFKDEIISYQELNNKANSAAQVLINHGVNTGDSVGINLKPSAQRVIIMLAAAKLGAAYLPLEPTYPQKRLQFMIEDSGLSFLISDQQKNSASTVKVLDTSLFEVSIKDTELAIHRSKATDTLYLMYTSGSTGQPKPVVITHQNVFRLADGSSFGGLSPDTIMLNHSSFSFDASVLEIWGTLVNGGELIIIDNEYKDPFKITETLEKHKVNFIFLSPLLLSEIINAGAHQLRSLQQITVGGDVFPPSTAELSLAALPEATFYNVYGPTENCVFSTYHQLIRHKDYKNSIPIGQSIDNSYALVLDEHRNLLPKGAVGELYLGGDGLSQGYAHRTDLTTTKFIESKKWGRIYKTGDIVRLNHQFEIMFIGRNDQQIKLRGFRIELGEVESILSNVVGVKNVVVIVKGKNQQARLVAYISPADIDIKALREHAHEHLMDFMRPSEYITLNEFPLSPNGKIDRQQLRRIQAENPTVFQQPSNPKEQLILMIWQSILGRQNIRVTDHFFEVGGNSLLAIQFITRVNAELNAGLKLKHIFKHPTIEDLAQQFSIGAVKSPIPPIVRDRNKDQTIPLSFAQQRLWTLQQFDGIGGTYNIPASLVLTGDLDCIVLNQCFNFIIQRHEILRTRFKNNDGRPYQHIDANIDFNITPETATEDQVISIYKQEASQPFNLELDQLMRVRLLQLSANKHVLLITKHHIISDGWSTGIFVEELSHCYSAYIEQKTPSLKALPVQYADYAIWQNKWLKGTELDQQLTFWQETLSGSPPLLELATDRPRPAVQSFNGSSISVELPSDVMKQIQTFCQEHGVTMYMFLLSSIQLVLSRYSGQSDIVIGSPVANRMRTEIEPMLGCFVNTIVLRSKIKPEQDFLTHLQTVKDITLNAYSNQDIPFEQVVEHLNVPRNIAHSPLFQVMLILQNTPKKALALGDIEITSLPIESSVSRFDMTFNLTEGRSGLSGNIEFNSDLFDVQTIQRMFEYLQHVIQGILSEPQNTIETISCLSPAQEKQLLQELKGQETDYRKFSSIPQEIEKIAMLRPDDIALRDQNEVINYQELNNKATSAAHIMHHHGVGAGDIVGIHLNPSTQRIVIMLAVAKLGAAYLPMEPTHPQKRLQFMIEDSGLKFIVSDHHRDMTSNITILDLSDLCVSNNHTDPSINVSKATDPFYLMYTSGSTGQPKPVVITHQNVFRLADSSSYGDSKSDAIMLNHCTFSFDISVYEIWVTLVHGGELIIVADEDKEPSKLCAIIEKHGVDSAYFSPLLLNEMINTDTQRLSRLKRITVGADAFPPSTAQLALASLPETTFYNAYGPTEDCVFSACYQLSRDQDYKYTVPIGNSIDNSYALILDERMNVLPKGAIGELWLGGDGLSQGYAHRTDLTAARFVESQRWGRIYNTGDLVKLNHQSEIIYIGRNDHQIKLRGFRIELGEIESVLLNVAGVNNMAVIMKGENEHARLVAYVSPADIDIKTLRQHAHEHLMDYMRPSEYIMLDEFPLTTSGKNDRNQLRRIETVVEPTIEQPANPKQQIILEVWQSVLQRQAIKVTDNFFDAGGNSLLLIRLSKKLSETLQLDVPVTALFQYTTIQAQSDYFNSENNKKPTTVDKADNPSKKHNRNANRHRRQKIKRRQS